VPTKIAERLQATIRFSVKLDLRSPELKFTEQTQIKITKHDEKGKKEAEENARHLKETLGITKTAEKIRSEYGEDFFASEDFDYESIPELRDHKIKSLQHILKTNVDRKYKISYFKGLQIFLEAIIMLLLMISIALKANVYSLVYLIFIYKFVLCTSKTQLLVRINVYMSILFFVQYLLYVLNLTAKTSPNSYPPAFSQYPKSAEDPTGLTIKYVVPWFFHYPAFHDLKIAYLLGIGVDKDQVSNLTVDFINLFIVSMYIMTFRNPILVKSMSKVFWQFP
jgi:hypothetical protein